MNSTKEIRTRTLQLMRELGEEHLGQPLQELGWTFEWDRAKRRLGRCHTKKRGKDVKIISLSKPRARKSGWAVMEDVARHEIAHALNYETEGLRGHGAKWKRWARKCGANPTRLYEGEDLEPLPSKYVGVCPNECGYQRSFYRKIKRWYFCPDCTNGASSSKRAYLHIIERRTERLVRRGGIGKPSNRPDQPTPERNFRDPKEDGYKYTATCPNCGHMTGYRRKLKRRYACSPCCKEYSNGKFDPQFEFEIRQNY